MNSFLISSNKEALCEGCRRVNIESLSAPGGYIHTSCVSELGPYKSCPLCDLIAEYPRPEREFTTVGCQSRLQVSKQGYLEICAAGTDLEAPNYESTIFVRTRLGDPASAYGVPIIADLTNTASEETLQQARSWLHHCYSKHDCGQALPFPSRKNSEDLGPTGSPQPGCSSDQASEPEHIPKPETKIRNTTKVVNWFKKSNPRSTGLGIHSIIKNPDYEGNLAVVKSLGTCQRTETPFLSHMGQQGVTPSTSQMPKRLIDLEAFGESSLDAKLIQEYGFQSKYVSLSYCWGNPYESNFTTTSHTLPSRLSRIEYSVIPTTFQHAFEITRGLGIRYIWIDALCILQDSLPDWEEESTNMGVIYSNSCVTIAADWGTSAVDGCYNEASETVLEGNKDLIRITSLLSCDIQSTLYLGSAYSRTVNEIEDSRLTTRAWAYQERVLSPRILHYTQKQVFWECRKNIRTEDMIPRKLPQIHPGFTSSCGRGYPLPGLIKLLCHMSNGSDGTSPLQIWYQTLISRSYATRNIRVSSDKLPALSALARLWSQYIPGPYLAGLWHHNLFWGLSWSRKGPLLVKPAEYRCPSWSWASLDCDVVWNGGYGHEKYEGKQSIMMRVEAMNMQVAGKDPFGRVSGGFLRVNGRVGRFYAAGGDLTSLSRDIIGKATMDTDRYPQPVGGLLLSLIHQKNRAFVLLISTTPSTSLGVVGFERKGFGYIYRSMDEPSVFEYFEHLEEQTITLI